LPQLKILFFHSRFLSDQVKRLRCDVATTTGVRARAADELAAVIARLDRATQ
jgi:hypothetical protein